MDLTQLERDYVSGTLTCQDGIVTVKGMYLNADMKAKLTKMIQQKGISRENQEFIINEMIINAEDQEIFEKGQSDLQHHGNVISSLSDSSKNPQCFDGEFVLLLPDSELEKHMFVAYSLVCEKMIFDIGSNGGNPKGNQIVYPNVKAMVSSTGKCKLILKEE